ncbi:hypothetical protein K402DRAFT_195429 [Aulographum hederae CBS 113979]|uniref:Uncharacterized protein n=1 Tax=Aulographum hederae CBS 113979 TaxID=1176131 RepID=A0A6G1GNR5_9PEZI|nr:hypothetical protein K402DRAFT_195429 [Aulographum hederae CBS 113979]
MLVLVLVLVRGQDPSPFRTAVRKDHPPDAAVLFLTSRLALRPPASPHLTSLQSPNITFFTSHLCIPARLSFVSSTCSQRYVLYSDLSPSLPLLSVPAASLWDSHPVAFLCSSRTFSIAFPARRSPTATLCSPIEEVLALRLGHLSLHQTSRRLKCGPRQPSPILSSGSSFDPHLSASRVSRSLHRRPHI